ncbi:MAG TPA: Hsp20/alpha crystallin family protein, partial [Chthoniobacterales bacterium]|nr:Hsp20/alpha crystallin family protein [Chthoniobacterales bacterium]
MNAKFFTFFVSLLILVSCSKNDSTTSVATATPSPSVSPIATATATEPATTTPVPTLSPTASPFADVGAQLRDLENRMDSIFADTFRNVGSWFNQETNATSIDLREQNDKYIARLYVPSGDSSNVDAKVENGVLHITAQNQGTVNGKQETERYEQFIGLAKPVNAGDIKVEKKNDVIVVTVPKTTASAPAVAATTATPAASASESPAPATVANANNAPAAGASPGG